MFGTQIDHSDGTVIKRLSVIRHIDLSVNKKYAIILL